MAYNVKYVLRYCNVNRKSLRIEILEDGYIGQAFLIVNKDTRLTNQDGDYIVVNIDGEYQEGRDENDIEGTDNPFTLQYNLDKEGKQVSIMTTVANMSFWADDLFNIDELLTSDETSLKTRFWLDDVMMWEGFVVPDFFSEEISEYRQVNLTSSDRVGILKDIKYPIDVTGGDVHSFFSILNRCLKLTGLDLGYEILSDFNCDEWDESENQSSFHKTFINELRFQKSDTDVSNCYEIIQIIMRQFNCFIVQHGGKWCIYNKEQLEKGNGTILTFDSNGVYISSRPFEQSDVWFSKIDTGGTRTIIPVGSENTVRLDFGKNVLYPKNYSFISTPIALNNWTALGHLDFDLTNQVPTDYNAAGDITGFYTNSLYKLKMISSQKRIEYDFSGYIGIGIDYRWPNLESDIFKVVTNGSNSMSFDLTIKAVGMPNTFLAVVIVMEFSDRPGDLYLMKDDGMFSFFKPEGPSTVPYTDKLLMLEFSDPYKNTLVAVDQEFKITGNFAPGRYQEQLDLHKATIKIRVYPNLHDKDEAVFKPKSLVKEIKLDFKSPSETPKSTIYQTTVEGNYTKKYDATTVMFGDFQEQGQNGYFYQYRNDSYSIIYNSIGEMTKNWTTINDTQKEPLLKHVVRQITKEVGKATNELRIGFDLESINPLAVYRVRCQSQKYILVNPEKDYLTNKEKFITANTGKYLNKERYLFAGGSIDFMRCEAEMTLIQCQDKEVESVEYIYSEF
ncbi:hypothetical protein [Sphingobacterium faecium]|uniref:hypothetical protein n=1 Tax=Sphingobacterium faecium TaxID=34087 RepID=UPI0024699BD2|nr:hypothetical protein [Sphingobacterium faecium]MDH5825774.1 hypothetical protein [Sphingobacterium faecium]